MNIPASRKLSGLQLCLIALLAILVLAVVSIALFGADWQLFAAFGGQVTGLGGMHQGAQMMADRSPNYPDVRGNYPTPPPPKGP